MVTDEQILLLRSALNKGMSLTLAAAKAGMNRKTAGKYRQFDRLPSEVGMEHTWRTRKDPFDEVWPELEQMLDVNPGLQAKTLFADLRDRYPGRFAEGQLRTLQRRIKQWRAENGPAKEVFFAQVHHPGRLAASDFRRRFEDKGRYRDYLAAIPTNVIVHPEATILGLKSVVERAS